MKRLAVFAFIVLSLLSFSPRAYAADAVFFGPIVPNGTNGQPNCICPGSAPDYGCVLQTIQNVINIVITFSFVILILYIALAGFQFVLSAGSAEARTAAKNRLRNVLLGILVVLSAWLIVDFVMKTLYGESGKFGPWNAILAGDSTDDLCLEVAANPPKLPGVIGGAPGGPTTGSSTGTGSNCPAADPSSMVQFPASAVSGEPESAAPATVQKFLAMREAALKDDVNLKVTDGYRSESEQLQLWEKYNHDTSQVGKPCTLDGSGSNHNRGVALDIAVGCSKTNSNCASKEFKWLKANGGKWDFYNNLPNDVVHWSPTGR